MKIKTNSTLFYLKREVSLFIMRLLIFVIALSLCSFAPGIVRSQNATIHIKVNQQLSVKEVFDLIRRQTNYSFIYPTDKITFLPRVEVKKGPVKVSTLLNKSLLGSNLIFEEGQSNTIVITEKPNIPFSEAPVIQGIKIKGVIKDINGVPIPGINVIVTSSKPESDMYKKDFVLRGTTTDFDGSYTIEGRDDYYLVVTGLGFKMQTIRIVKGTSNYDFTMKEEVSNLNEVMVVGYGTTKKKDLTGAVGSLKSEEIVKIKSQTFEQALGGHISGVNVSPVSGRPGAGATINIRGLSALRGDNQPLYVIDGVPITVNPAVGNESLIGQGQRENPLLAINPNDIERIDVLKDASSAAIYGSRAANGVIIVTTKRGKKNQKAQFNFGMNSTFQNPTSRFDFLNAEQYKAFNTEQAKARIAAGTGTATDNQIVNGTYFGTANTDWQDEITNNNALWNDYFFNVNGGTNSLNYLMSANVTDQEGLMIGSKFKRYNYTSNFDVAINDYLKIGSSITYNYSVNKNSNVTEG